MKQVHNVHLRITTDTPVSEKTIETLITEYLATNTMHEVHLGDDAPKPVVITSLTIAHVGMQDD